MPISAKEVNFEQSIDLKKIRDIVELAEDSVAINSDLLVGFSIFGLKLEIDPDYERIMSTSRLDTVSELRKELDDLSNSYGGLVSDLYAALDKVGKKLQKIRDMEEPIDISDLEDCMENSKGSGIVDQLEDNFIDRIEGSEYQYEKKIASVLKVAESIEKKYDSLEYIMGKVRLYGRDEIKEEVAYKLREIVLTITDGERIRAINALLALLRKVQAYRNIYIKGSEADRIRYKADYILRKVNGSQTKSAIDVAISTALSDIDLELTLKGNRVNHIAPSDDKKSQDVKFRAEKARENWSGSFSYVSNDRDYLDRLSDDDDRFSNELKIELDREYPLFDLIGAVDWEVQLFPNEIGDEIEVAKIGTCKAAINDLIQYIKAQDLALDLESKLIEGLDETKDYLNTRGREAREEAVDSLEDFLEEVEDQFWDSNLSKPLFNELIERGDEILPRESRRFFKFYGESEFNWESHQFTIHLGQERRKYPADSEEDRIIKRREIEYAGQFENFTVGSLVKREKTEYLRDPDSNKHKFQRQIETKLDQNGINLSSSYNWERTTYPHALDKNNSLSERIWEVQVNPYLTVNWENESKTYPHRSYKDWSTTKTTVEVELGPEITINRETELKKYPYNLTKNVNSHTLEIGVGKEISESTEVEFSAKYTDKNYPHNPYKNKKIASFTATLEWEF